MIKAVKYRLYPTESQKVLLAKHFGVSRYIYNWTLDWKTKNYAATQHNVNWMKIAVCDDFKKLKSAHEWIHEVNSQSIQASIKCVDVAFKNFFEHRANFPKFHSKHSKQSFKVPQHFEFDFKNSKLHLPKFKDGIKVIIHRRLPSGKLGQATVSKDCAGRYFVSVLVHTDESEPNMPLPSTNSIGIDFGLKHFLTVSDGQVFDSTEPMKKNLAKLRKLNERLSRKKKGSKNRDKTRMKLAKLHRRIAESRKDFLHKLSTRLVRENQADTICIEDLNMESMRKLWGRKVSDLSWSEFVSMLEYKCRWYGKSLVKIGRFEPSSQICSKCGHRQKMPLDRRVYVCPKCGQTIDRDLNAAINIRNFGTNQYQVPQELRKLTTEERKALMKVGTRYVKRSVSDAHETGLVESVKIRGRENATAKPRHL